MEPTPRQDSRGRPHERRRSRGRRAADESQAWLAAIIECSQDAVIGKDLDGVILSWNAAAERVFGYTAEEAIGQSVLVTVPEDKRKEQAELSAQVRRGHGFEHFETTRLRKDGRVIDVSLSVSPVRAVSGEVVGAAVIARDVTANLGKQRHMEALHHRLEESAAELKRSNAELEAFAYVASHDLQEPLRKIMAFGELLERRAGPALDEGAKDFLKRMREAASRMSRLIQDLLQLSRVGRDTLPYQAVDLNKTVAADLIDLEAVIKEAGATIEVGPLPTVKGNPFQLRQLFQNLLSNAVKFRRKDVPPSIKVAARDDGAGHVVIEVADNGTGFDEAYLDRVFQPFQRLVTRQEFPGTGMGLALCRKIAERHGGSITARSTPGAGSVFVVSLPAATRPASETPPAQAP